MGVVVFIIKEIIYKFCLLFKKAESLGRKWVDMGLSLHLVTLI